MLRVIAQASPQTRIEGRPASATAPRDRIAGFNARRRVEMWKSTNRISTFPRRTKKRIDWEWPLHRKEGNKGRSEEGASSDLEPGAARLTASGRNGVHEKPVGSVLLVYPVSHARVRAGGAAGRPASPATPRLSPGSIRVIRVIRVPG